MLKKTVITYILFIYCNNYLFAQDLFVSGDNLMIAKCNIQNCIYQIIGSTSKIMMDLAITPNGKLYGTDGKKLYSIDTLNANSQYIGLLIDTNYSGGQWINALVSINNQYLLGIGSSDTLYKISVDNAHKSSIGTVGYSSAGDLAFYNRLLYLADINGNLIEIRLTGDCNQIISVNSIGYMPTPFSSLYGLATIGKASCFESTLKIIAVEGSTLYEVNSSNAHLTLLCSDFLPFSAQGAASKKENSNQDFSSSFSNPNIFTPNNDGYNDSFRPIEYNNIFESNIIIFNRWGKIVYESNDVPFDWNGQSKIGENCSDGVYYYVIKLKDICNNINEYKGTVTLIR